jgi:purine-binding chemotaxis protein CheW
VPKRKRSVMDEKGTDVSRLASRLVCRAGTHLCAMPLRHVVEVMRILPTRLLAGVPPYVRGVSIIRGSPVPVVDTGWLMGGQATRSERLVAITTGGRNVALAVEAVIGIRSISEDTSDALPALLRNAATDMVAAQNCFSFCAPPASFPKTCLTVLTPWRR